MVAGATGIDLYLMTVAADDGVMPQTREHATVLRALGVQTGVIAVTKSDLADPDVAMIEASELLGGAEPVAVSARTGAGIDELRSALERAAGSLSSRAESPGSARLHIDRSFTIRGAGTVVTGTLWSGAVARGDELELLPEGRRVRVRAVQVHDRAVDRAAAGQRVAVNLTGVPVTEVARGDALASPDGELRPTYLIDALLELGDSEPEHVGRVQVHHGTRETPARVAWLGGSFWQLRLEHRLIAARGDRLVIRQIAPPDTLGGGVVLDATPKKHGPSRDLLTRLERLSRGEPVADSERVGTQASGGAAGARDSRKHVPRSGSPSEPKPLPPSALALAERLRQAGLEPPLDSELDAADLAALRAAGKAVRVSKNLHYHPDILSEVRERVIALARRSGGAISLAAFRDELGTSRKFAQALLEHFDSERLTIRRGDEHVLRRNGEGM
jgi:selenocysteine-specific elongation factor